MSRHLVANLTDPTDEKDYAALMAKSKDGFTIRDIDLDGYADGVLAHRRGEPFHACPYKEKRLAALSWRLGWNERALR